MATANCKLEMDFWGCWLLAIGDWLLAVGYWLLVVGCWLLAVGKKLKAKGCVLAFHFICRSRAVALLFANDCAYEHERSRCCSRAANRLLGFVVGVLALDFGYWLVFTPPPPLGTPPAWGRVQAERLALNLTINR